MRRALDLVKKTTKATPQIKKDTSNQNKQLTLISTTHFIRKGPFAKRNQIPLLRINLYHRPIRGLLNGHQLNIFTARLTLGLPVTCRGLVTHFENRKRYVEPGPFKLRAGRSPIDSNILTTPDLNLFPYPLNTSQGTGDPIQSDKDYQTQAKTAHTPTVKSEYKAKDPTSAPIIMTSDNSTEAIVTTRTSYVLTRNTHTA